MPEVLLLRCKPIYSMDVPGQLGRSAEEAEACDCPRAGAVAKQFALVVQALTAARALEAQRQGAGAPPPPAPARQGAPAPPPRASHASAAAVPPPPPRAAQPAPGANSTGSAAMRPPAALRQDEDPWRAQRPAAAVERALAEAQALADAVRARCLAGRL